MLGLPIRFFDPQSLCVPVFISPFRTIRLSLHPRHPFEYTKKSLRPPPHRVATAALERGGRYRFCGEEKAGDQQRHRHLFQAHNSVNGIVIQSIRQWIGLMTEEGTPKRFFFGPLGPNGGQCFWRTKCMHRPLTEVHTYVGRGTKMPPGSTE